ncbi:cysteine hydrolase [Streptomyces sp. NPDC004980]
MANAARVAQTVRQSGAKVIHVHFVTEPAADGAGDNIPLFAEITIDQTVVRGTYGARPFPGAEPQPGDLALERPRMSAFHGAPLDAILRNLGSQNLILTGVHTNHDVGTTARVAADLGYTPTIATLAITEALGS